MRDFVREFRKNPNPALNWPGTAQGPQASEEFSLLSRVLFESVNGHKKASAVDVSVPAASTDLHARLVAFLDEYKNPNGDANGGWPKKDATIPARAGKRAVDHRTLRLWEVAVVLQDLIGGVATTVQEGDGAGGTPRWPPH